MNVFYTDEDPEFAAAHVADMHLAKMPTEAAQIASTALVARGIPVGMVPCKPAYRSHPVVKMAAANDAYLTYVIDWGIALCEERHHRFPARPRHKTHDKLIELQDMIIADRSRILPDLIPQAMPRGLRDEFEPIKAYRSYLSAKYAEWHHRDSPRVRATWTNRDRPYWIDLDDNLRQLCEAA